MPYSKPAKLPRYTFLDDGNGTPNDVVNPTSGQNNVVEPSESKKDLGWDFKEFPPRNFMNWLHRLTGQWLGYLNQERDAMQNFAYAANSTPITLSVGPGTIDSGSVGILRIKRIIDESNPFQMFLMIANGTISPTSTGGDISEFYFNLPTGFMPSSVGTNSLRAPASYAVCHKQGTSTPVPGVVAQAYAPSGAGRIYVGDSRMSTNGPGFSNQGLFADPGSYTFHINMLYYQYVS